MTFVERVQPVPQTMTEDDRLASDSLGDWLVPILLIVVVTACGYIVWQRFKQRKGGWA